MPQRRCAGPPVCRFHTITPAPTGLAAAGKSSRSACHRTEVNHSIFHGESATVAAGDWMLARTMVVLFAA